MSKPRSLLAAGMAAAATVAIAAPPALAESGKIRTTDRSGHLAYKVTERKDPDSKQIRKTLVVKVCDDRKDGAGITAVVAPAAATIVSGHGVGTCTKPRTFSGTAVFTDGSAFSIRVCRQDISGDGKLRNCRQRNL